MMFAGLMIGGICGFTLACGGQLSLERSAARRGIVKLNGDYYRIEKIIPQEINKEDTL
jgi:hypothetical protein